jgi:hypothetical protein
MGVQGELAMALLYSSSSTALTLRPASGLVWPPAAGLVPADPSREIHVHVIVSRESESGARVKRDEAFAWVSFLSGPMPVPVCAYISARHTQSPLSHHLACGPSCTQNFSRSREEKENDENKTRGLFVVGAPPACRHAADAGRSHAADRAGPSR